MSNELVSPEAVAAMAEAERRQQSLLSEIGSDDFSALSVSNFSGSPQELYELESKARGAGVESGSDQVGQVIEIEHWYVHRASSTGRDGQIEHFPRCVVIQPDGRAFSFSSKGVFDDIARIAKFFGTKRLSPPIKVKVDVLKTKQGFKLVKLVPVSTRK